MKLKISKNNRPGSLGFEPGNFYYVLCTDFYWDYLNVDEFDCGLIIIIDRTDKRIVI
jgi:hypothetical protein